MMKIAILILLISFSSFANFANDDYYCPKGTTYNSVNRICMNTTKAIGPFPPAMVNECKTYNFQSEDCERNSWDIFYAGSIRGTDECPKGTKMDTTMDVCRDGDFAYGPFKKDQVANCRDFGGGNACETMKWDITLVTGKFNPPVSPTIPGNPMDSAYLGERILAVANTWVGRHYKKGMGKMCAAFVREVLREACNTRFSPASRYTIYARRAWDDRYIDSGGPLLASSLAGSEVGTKISKDKLQRGDLVFFTRTYGPWDWGVITHVAVYSGNSKVVHRSTKSSPVAEVSVNSWGRKNLLYGARVNPALCDAF